MSQCGLLAPARPHGWATLARAPAQPLARVERREAHVHRSDLQGLRLRVLERSYNHGARQGVPV
eukprot:4087025-Pyramimonas_sp.AAC.1